MIFGIRKDYSIDKFGKKEYLLYIEEINKIMKSDKR